MAAKKATPAQQLTRLKRDDAAFAALAGSLATDSAGALDVAKREVVSLHKGAKRSNNALVRLRKRLVRDKAAATKADTAANRKAVRTTEAEVTKARREKASTREKLAEARARLAESKEIAAKHKKYAAALGKVDKVRAKPVRRKRRAKRATA